ncbi:MAG: hypothetical protein J5710_14265 [Treponema sp.]|nr:hypothetical protein [Treponema sp.]
MIKEKHLSKYKKYCNESSKIIWYGNLDGKNIQGYKYSVYAIFGCCAAINTGQGGGQEPFILIKL